VSKAIAQSGEKRDKKGKRVQKGGKKSEQILLEMAVQETRVGGQGEDEKRLTVSKAVRKG